MAERGAADGAGGRDTTRQDEERPRQRTEGSAKCGRASERRTVVRGRMKENREREREKQRRGERTRGRKRGRCMREKRARETEGLHPCAAVAVAVAETEPALVIYINPIIAWRFPN